MKIVCISDTHNMHDKIDIPDGDVLVHAGDLSNIGKMEDFERFNSWLGTLPHDKKIVVPGNHDISAGNENQELVKSIMTNCDFLIDSGIKFKGIKFWGIPWTPSFFKEHWVFNVDRGEDSEKLWSTVDPNADVIICHGPPYKHGDLCPSMHDKRFSAHVGCEEAFKFILKNKPKLFVCGHIHEGYGTYIALNGTVVVNASTCTGNYQPINNPIVINV